MKSCSLPCTRLVFPDRPSRNQFSVLSTGLVLVLMPVLSGYFLLSFSTMCWIVGLLETRNFSFCISDLSYWSILSELPENKLSIDYIDLCIQFKNKLGSVFALKPSQFTSMRILQANLISAISVSQEYLSMQL